MPWSINTIQNLLDRYSPDGKHTKKLWCALDILLIDSSSGQICFMHVKGAVQQIVI